MQKITITAIIVAVAAVIGSYTLVSAQGNKGGVSEQATTTIGASITETKNLKFSPNTVCYDNLAPWTGERKITLVVIARDTNKEERYDTYRVNYTGSSTAVTEWNNMRSNNFDVSDLFQRAKDKGGMPDINIPADVKNPLTEK